MAGEIITGNNEDLFAQAFEEMSEVPYGVASLDSQLREIHKEFLRTWDYSKGRPDWNVLRQSLLNKNDGNEQQTSADLLAIVRAFKHVFTVNGEQNKYSQSAARKYRGVL